MGGVIRVSKDRWVEAQRWESRHWIHTQRERARFGKNFIFQLLSLVGLAPKYRGDDWNHWWALQFDNYSFLPSRVRRAIEVGCGPYTNMRLISEKCLPDQLVLSDPLIETYIQFRLTFLSEMYRRKRCLIDNHMLEECPFPDKHFDLVVMINVLDHVQDAECCIRQAIRITADSGILIIGQDLSNDDDMRAMEGMEGEQGHPIKIEHHLLDRLLQQSFTPIVKKILPRELGRAPSVHYGTYIFAGQREREF